MTRHAHPHDACARAVDRAFENTPVIAATTVGEVTVTTRCVSSYPLLYLTAVDGGVIDGAMEHYAWLAEAEAGHAAWVQRVEDLVALELARAAAAPREP